MRTSLRKLDLIGGKGWRGLGGSEPGHCWCEVAERLRGAVALRCHRLGDNDQDLVGGDAQPQPALGFFHIGSRADARSTSSGHPGLVDPNGLEDAFTEGWVGVLRWIISAFARATTTTRI